MLLNTKKATSLSQNEIGPEETDLMRPEVKLLALDRKSLLSFALSAFPFTKGVITLGHSSKAELDMTLSSSAS